MTKLTLPTIITGMAAAGTNATELMSDAEVLLSAGRDSRAFMLLHCAAEELGKYFMLEVVARKMALKAPINWSRFWKRIRSHDSKMAHAGARLEAFAEITPALRLEVARGASELWWRAGIEPRNRSLYVEIQEGKVRAPNDIDWSIGVDALGALVNALLEAARQIGLTEIQITASLQDGPKGNPLAPFMVQLSRYREAGMTVDQIHTHLNKIWALTHNEKAPTVK